MTLDDFLPYVLPYAQGCPNVIAKLNIRLAIIELCRKSKIWREYQPAIVSIADQTAHAYTPAASQQVCGLLSLTVDGTSVPVVNPALGKALDAKQYGPNYAYGGMTGFELHPAQEAGLDIITYAAVAPTIAATVIPDSMSRYIEEIGKGALARILISKDKQYGDLALAGAMRDDWDMAIETAKSDALNGYSRATTRTAMVSF